MMTIVPLMLALLTVVFRKSAYGSSVNYVNTLLNVL